MTDKAIPRPECPRGPDEFDIAFGRQLVAYLGGDPSPIEDDWCWRAFGKQYPELLEPALEYFRTAQEGEPAYGIFALACWCDLDVERSLSVIRKVSVGDPARAICGLVDWCWLPLDLGFSAIRQIEVGNPAVANGSHCHGCP